MSEKITQTLFRFRSLRSPELLSDQAKENYFIKHPTATESGHFWSNTLPVGPSENKRVKIEAAASSFSESLETVEDVKSLDANLYALGSYLMTNRSSLNLGDTTPLVTSSNALTASDNTSLWEHLFYQTVTQKDSYLREAIITVLLANHVKENWSSITDNSELLLWANSRVVMPKELFAFEDPYQAATANSETIISTAIHDKHMTAAICDLKANQAEKALNEIDKAEKAHRDINTSIQKSEIATFQAAETNYLTVVNQASNRIAWTDQATGFTFDVIDRSKSAVVNATPVFTYEATPEINSSEIQSIVSEEAFYVMEENSILEVDSFVKARTKTKEFIKRERDTAFNNTDFNLESVSINGTAIPTCSLESRYNQKNSYLMKAVKKANNSYALLLTVDVGSPCLKLSSVTSSHTSSESSSTSVRFKASNRNGIVTINLTPDSSASISDSATEQSLSGTLTFDNGLKLSYDHSLNMADGTSGIMTEGSNEIADTGLFVPSSFGLKRIGISDYRKVESHLCCYLPGEVSHIENVMAREYKERSTRRLRSRDSSTSTSTEVESENQTDTSSTSRFDMQKEVSEVLSSSIEYGNSTNSHSGWNVGGSVTGNYGTKNANVSATVSGGYDASNDSATNFASNTSKEKSTNQAMNFSQEVVEKALSRVVSKVKEERVVRVIEEFEEQNRHGFDNRQGDQHISGVFRWVDKVYKNEIFNYGKRLQYEFMIPEPSAFHLIAKASGMTNGTSIPIVKPLDPRNANFGMLKPLKSAADVTESNYQQWAAVYKGEVSPPPAKTKLIGTTITRPDNEAWHVTKAKSEKVIIPEGYGLDRVTYSTHGHAMKEWSNYAITVGDETKVHYTSEVKKRLFLADNRELEVDKYINEIPVAVTFMGIAGGMVGISLELIRKEETYVAWQLETYNAIMEAYDERLQEYKDSIAELEAKKGLLLADNPAYYRDIINTVIKKNCISYLIGHSNMGVSHVSGSEMRDFYVNISEDMDKYAAVVKFFEQAFEWDIMDYVFYPFYWAGRDKWSKLYGHDNDDPLFRSFLQSGMARSIITVRPGFEEAVMHYMETGIIWNGGEVPVIGDDLHLSIIEELKDPEYTVGASWETRVPSTLTLIQAKTIALEAEGLPCYCDDDNPPTETIGEPTTNPLEGLNVHLGGTVG